MQLDGHALQADTDDWSSVLELAEDSPRPNGERISPEEAKIGKLDTNSEQYTIELQQCQELLTPQGHHHGEPLIAQEHHSGEFMTPQTHSDSSAQKLHEPRVQFEKVGFGSGSVRTTSLGFQNANTALKRP